MNRTEQSVLPIQFTQTSRIERFSRSLLFRVLNYLHVGHLTILERGTQVGVFGTPESALMATIDIQSPRTYQRFLFGGDIGAGESFVEAEWTSPDLTKVIELFAANLHVMDRLERKLSWLAWPVQRLHHLRRRNSRTRAKENIAAHYDLGNELYTRFLDARMQYSSAVFPTPESTLDDAQEVKLERLCTMLDLQPTDHLVEIGTGWGGLAIFAASRYGCKVTTTTISEAQYEHAQALVKAQGLEKQVTLLKSDYRDLQGQFDKLVSVEMIEAVGAEFMPVFFKKCNDLLKPGGTMVLQAITIADQRLERYNRNVDFIQKYIFPGGYLPSVELINRMYRRHTQLVMRDMADIGIDYAYTLRNWRSRFNQNMPELRTFGYDDRFSRLWNYYLCYCEGGFLQRTISAVQIKATKALHGVSL